MTNKYVCPTCSKKTGVEIVYGMPSEELAKKAELGEVALGGCVVEPNQPDYRCISCGFEWDRTRQFEEAKNKWLKETVKGRSWVEMMNDKDRADDEKVNALMTPEYLAMWGKTSSEFDELEGDLESKSNLDKKIKK